VTPIEQLALGAILMVLLMLGLWLIQLKTRDAGIVDFGWSAGLGLMALFLAWTSDGFGGRRILLALVAGTWSLRLAAYLLRDRVLAHEEDGRYRELRRSWGGNADRNLLLFFQFQALLVIVFALPFLVVAHHPHPEWTSWDLAGVFVGFGAIVGESIADRQLARFRKLPANRGRTCRTGLWRYSRHPNYFFEWLHWWAYVLMAVGSPWWWLSLLGPALMLLFLFRITGIPATEQRALATRGDDYRRYQRTTSAFFPWFPKEDRS
jgi:steroid 5-alpha reductase family enzyme